MDDEIAGYCVENRPSYERAAVYRLAVESREVAEELRSQILEEEESFCLLAMQHSTDCSTALMGGYMGEISRSDVSGETENAIFSAQPGDVLGPIEAKNAWHLYLVHSMRTIPLEQVEHGIRERLFDEMVSSAVKQADVAYLVSD